MKMTIKILAAVLALGLVLAAAHHVPSFQHLVQRIHGMN
jgi:hypothetical protein